MKASDSVNSLTHLQDTGCIVCSESAGEKGEELVASKELTKCACQYMVHLSCWDGSRKCLSCGKNVIPHLVRVIQRSGDSDAEGEESEKKGGLTQRYSYLLFFVVACVIAFVIYMAVSFHRGS